MEFKLKGNCDNCGTVDYLQCVNIYSHWVCDTCHIEMKKDANTFENNFKMEIVAIVANRRKYSKTKNLVIVTISEAIKKLPKGKALKITALTSFDKTNRYATKNKIYRAGVLAECKISCKWDRNGTPIITHRK